MDLHAYEGRKRPYSEHSDDNGQNPTLGGGYWAEAGKRHTTISAQNHQQRRHTFCRTLPAHLSVPVWDRSLQGCPELYPFPVRQPQRQLDRDLARRSEPSSHDAPFQSLYESPILCLPSENTSMTFGHMILDTRQRDMSTVAPYSTNSGSDNSITLHRSYSISQTASQGGTLDLNFDTPGDLPYAFSGEIANVYPLAGGIGSPTGDSMAEYSEALLSSTQASQYPGIWQHREVDLPWSPINPSREHSVVLTRRPRMSPLSEEVLNCHASGRPVQSLHPSSLYPSQISSPLTDSAWPLNEAELLDPALQWPGTLPDHAEGSILDGNLMFFHDQTLSELPIQDQEEREDSPYLPPIFNRQNFSSNAPWSPVDIPRTVNLMPRDLLLTDRTMHRNEELSDEVRRAFDEPVFNAQAISSERNNQATPSDKSTAPMASSDHKWENAIVLEGAFQQLNGQRASKETKKQPGRRTGPLPTESKRKAGQIRKTGACWRCWFLHLSCSLEPVCSQCQSPPFSLSSHICNKVHLCDYIELLFPPLIVARRHPSAVQQQIDDNFSGFTNNRIIVYMSSGPAYPPMSFSAYELVPIPNDFHFLYYAPPNIHSPMPILERVYAPPLGILDSKDDSKVVDSCQEHIRGMIKHSRYFKEATGGDASLLSWKVYEAVNRYRNARHILGNSEFLRKVIKLHAMHFFMSRVITFTKDSAKEVTKNLRSPPQLPYGRRASSKLLGNQIKREMHLLQRALTKEILEKLEKELRKRSRDSWATSFCVILILSMCMEAVQIAADGFIVQTMLESNGCNTIPVPRDDAIEISRLLDGLLFKDCMYIFHMIHRSGESRGKSQKGFNPIRDGIRFDPEHVIDDSTVQLVDDIRRIIRDYDDELDEKASNPTGVCEEGLLADHYRFRRQNSGRLVAKFLKSFFEES